MAEVTQEKKRPFKPLFPPREERVCEVCRYWQRKGATSFGGCFRWQEEIVEGRDGVSAERFVPLVPELAYAINGTVTRRGS